MIGMIHSILAQAPATAETASAFAALVKDLGVPTTMLAFFTWWSYTREKRLNDRLDGCDEFIRSKLLGAITDVTTALNKLLSDKKTLILLVVLFAAAAARADQYGTNLQFPAGVKAVALVPANSIRDMAIDGAAGIRDYPWSYNQWHPQFDATGKKVPDLTGPDCEQLADGVVLDGDEPAASNLQITQIAGTGLVIKNATQTIARASVIHVHSAINGVDVEATDARLDNLTMDNIVHESVSVHGGGNVFIDTAHVTGGDVGYHFAAKVIGNAIFADNQRIGAIFDGISWESHVTNFCALGCWERSCVIGENGITLDPVDVHVPLETAEHPSTAGLEILPNLSQADIRGSIKIDGDAKLPNATATGTILRGSRHKLDLKGGWDSPAKATFVRCEGHIAGTTLDIRGSGDGGTALDLSATDLNNVAGDGNEFKIHWGGTAARVIYPGGGTKFNLAPGTQLWIDGVLQTATTDKI